jgi:hypothetical protein
MWSRWLKLSYQNKKVIKGLAAKKVKYFFLELIPK